MCNARMRVLDVSKADFDRDPKRYMLQAGPNTQVIVRDAAGVTHFAFGGDVVMSPEEREEQRRSFVFGNVAMANPAVTRDSVDKIAGETPVHAGKITAIVDVSCPFCGNDDLNVDGACPRCGQVS